MILISPLILIYKVFSIYNPYLNLNSFELPSQLYVMFLLDFSWNPWNNHIHMTNLYFSTDKRANIVGAMSIGMAMIVGEFIDVFTLYTVFFGIFRYPRIG